MILKLGATGLDVRTLQAALRALDLYKPPAAIDGAFGPKTELAVKAFQLANGLTVDGVVGPVTWTALLAPASRAPYPIPRCWPLKCLPDGRKPVITSGHYTRNPERSNPPHLGVDIMFPYRLNDPPMKVGDAGRAKTWWIPPNTFAVAPFAGEIVLADDSPTGKRAWLKHPSGWNAGFFHMDEFAVAVGWTVNMGAVIGRVADSPRGEDPRHLHFELVFGDIVDIVKRGLHNERTVDPELMLALTPFLP